MVPAGRLFHFSPFFIPAERFCHIRKDFISHKVHCSDLIRRKTLAQGKCLLVHLHSGRFIFSHARAVTVALGKSGIRRRQIHTRRLLIEGDRLFFVPLYTDAVKVTLSQRPHAHGIASVSRFLKAVCRFPVILLYRAAFHVAAAHHEESVQVPCSCRFPEIGKSFPFIKIHTLPRIVHKADRCERLPGMHFFRLPVQGKRFFPIFFHFFPQAVHIAESIERTPIPFFCAFLQPEDSLLPALFHTEPVQIHIAQLISSHDIPRFRRLHDRRKIPAAKHRPLLRARILHVRQIQLGQQFADRRAFPVPVAGLRFIPVFNRAETVIVILTEEVHRPAAACPGKLHK